MDSENIQPFTSRTLRGYQEEIERTRDPYTIQILRAKCAAVLAHSSNVSAARSLIAEIRAANENYEPRLSAWVMYCDGLVIHSSNFDNRGALDRFRRAHIFGCAVRDAELSGSSAAWMAQCYFSLGETERTIEYLNIAFEWSHPQQHGAMARACAVLADAIAWTGDEPVARPWYNRARMYASSFGDIAMQNAVIYNSAAFRVSNALLSQCTKGLSSLDLQLAETEAISATTLNTLIGNSNNMELIILLKAEAMSLVGNWAAAEDLFKQYFGLDDIRDLTRYEPKLLSHRALCLAKLGLPEQSMCSVRAVVDGIDTCKDLDDIAITHDRLAQTYELLGDIENSNIHRKASDFSLREFREIQRKARSELQVVIDKFAHLERSA